MLFRKYFKYTDVNIIICLVWTTTNQVIIESYNKVTTVYFKIDAANCC